MTTLDWLITCSLLLTLLTKILDVFSTLKYVPSYAERNPIPRFLEKKLGLLFSQSVCLIFLAALILILSTFLIAVFFIESPILKCLIIVIALIDSYFQFGAFLYNAKGILIPFMRQLLSFRFYN